VGTGDAYLELKNYAEAQNAYKAAIKLKNDNWEAYAGFGDALRGLGSFNEAESNYNLAVTLYTRVKDVNKDVAADLYSKAAYAIGRQCPLNMAKFVPCKWTAAIQDLEKAVALSDSTLDYANLGWAYYNAARMDFD